MRKFLKVGLCGAAALMMFATGCSGQKSAKDASQAESTAEGETPAETEEYVAEGSITLGEMCIRDRLWTVRKNLWI